MSHWSFLFAFSSRQDLLHQRHYRSHSSLLTIPACHLKCLHLSIWRVITTSKSRLKQLLIPNRICSISFTGLTIKNCHCLNFITPYPHNLFAEFVSKLSIWHSCPCNVSFYPQWTWSHTTNNPAYCQLLSTPICSFKIARIPDKPNPNTDWWQDNSIKKVTQRHCCMEAQHALEQTHHTKPLVVIFMQPTT